MDVPVYAVDSLATMFLLPFRSGQNEPAARLPAPEVHHEGEQQRSRIVELSNGSLLNRTGKVYTSVGSLRDACDTAHCGAVRQPGPLPSGGREYGPKGPPSRPPAAG